MMSEDEDSSVDDIEHRINNWYPRDVLRRTNWLYRVDALRPHDLREMDIIWELCELMQEYASRFIILAYSLRAIVNFTSDHVLAEKLETIVKTIIKLIEMFWSEGYCYFLDF